MNMLIYVAEIKHIEYESMLLRSFPINILSNTRCEKSFVKTISIQNFLKAIGMFQKLHNRKDKRIIFIYLKIINSRRIFSSTDTISGMIMKF